MYTVRVYPAGQCLHNKIDISQLIVVTFSGYIYMSKYCISCAYNNYPD